MIFLIYSGAYVAFDQGLPLLHNAERKGDFYSLKENYNLSCS